MLERPKTLMLLLAALTFLNVITVHAETLTRGLVAIHKTTGGNFVSWRLQADDPEGTTFDLLRDGTTVATGLATTNYTDARGTADSRYQVVVHATDGSIAESSAEAQTWAGICTTMTLQRPEGGSFSYTKGQLRSGAPQADSTGYYTYYPQEASVADADGDGELELVVKWNPTASKDNAEDGFTGNQILDCYHLDYGQIADGKTADGEAADGQIANSKLLWRIDLGPNIRSGSHYTQFLFYDFNGDGKAEMICKTGPGSVDGQGRYVTEAADDETILATDNAKDWRTPQGRIMSGPEFLTVFDGQTGAALHTIWYNPNRGFTTGRASGYGSWGDDYGNRGERFLACVAHLGGADANPSAVMCRGYYTRAYLWAVDFDGQKLSTRWLHASLSKTRVEVTDASGQKTVSTYNTNTSGKGDSYTAYGQGCHSIAVGDVDGDGCDEIMYGAAAIDHDGSLLYSTGLGHGDAHHLADLYPDRPGLEFMMPHEENDNGWHVRDAATGELLVWKPSAGDNGRGMAADIDLTHRGAEFWSDADQNVYDLEGNAIYTNRPSYCFRTYWDGTLKENLQDGRRMEAYNNGTITRLQNFEGVIKNGTKAYPVLQADLFGDWREEVIFCSEEDSCTLKIFSTTTETKFSVPTLMSDHLYRLSVAWQNVGYNQPPHLSYYLPDRFATRFDVVGQGQKEQTVSLGQSIVPITCQLKNCTSAMVYATYLDGQRVKAFGVPDGFTFALDRTALQFTLSGTPTAAGTYEIVVRSSGDVTGNRLEDTLRVVVSDDFSGISDIYDFRFGTEGRQSSHLNSQSSTLYDLQGRRLGTSQRAGIYIRNNKKYTKQ